VYVQKAHQAAVQVIQKADQMIEAEHYNKERMQQIVESITSRWQQLMFRAEERLKLVMASMNWFKTAEQVLCTSVVALHFSVLNDQKLTVLLYCYVCHV
jgi:PIN domain nuclease of toxin-antitoxin system